MRNLPKGDERLLTTVVDVANWVVTLDVPHTVVLAFEALTESNRVTSGRKRRKAGLPPDKFLLLKWFLVRSRQEHELRNLMAWFPTPLTTPEQLHFTSEPNPLPVVGDRIELRLEWVSRARAKPIA